MANLFTKTMAPILLLFLLLTSTATAAAAAKVTGQELDAALFALRSRGYTLFPNAITTSDIRLLLLTLNSTFTLFSPPDPLIYSLDLSSTAPVYVHSLLRHVSPVRLSMSDLRSIRGSPYLDTLIPPHRMSIGRSLVLDNGTVSDIVLVDGVRISFPDLFLGSGIVVHGLEGILVTGLGPSSRDEQVDLPVDPPVVSPASWSEKDSMASSPTPDGSRLVDPPLVSPASWSAKDSIASSPTPEGGRLVDPPLVSPASWFAKDSPSSSPTPDAGELDDPLAVSPASWYDKDSLASSPTPEAAGLSGILAAQLRAKRRDDGIVGCEIEHSTFVKYSRRRFGV